MTMEFNNREFRTQAAAKQFYKELIARNKDCVLKPDDFGISNQDYLFMYDLFQNHPTAKRKEDIAYFEIKLFNYENVHTDYSSFVVYTDGTETNFSYTTCITGKSKSDTIQKVYRAAIQDTILAYRIDHGHKQCCYINHIGPLVSGTDVDHAHPKTFKSLMNDFAKTESCTLDHKDVEQTARWKIYHDKHCHLRWVCRTCNNSTIKQDIKKEKLTKKNRYTEYDLFLEQLKNKNQEQ